MQNFEFSVQAALGIFDLSATALIICNAYKQISPSAEDDKEAPPHRGHSVKNIN